MVFLKVEACVRTHNASDVGNRLCEIDHDPKNRTIYSLHPDWGHGRDLRLDPA
jgi:hypothetical protein